MMKTKKKKAIKTKKPKTVPSKGKDSAKSVCPLGSHWVKTHSMKVRPSKKNPTGKTIRHAHCARNPASSSKINLTIKELTKIAQQSSFLAAKKPCPNDLGYKNIGNKYDDLIAGWVEYWNGIFESKEPLDPNLVKALISTESGFNSDVLADPKNPDSARGLMQLRNDTREILGNSKGELKDYFISITRDDLNDPGTNICAGVRWLLHKRKLLAAKSKKKKREPTWKEVIDAYKGGKTVKAARAKELLDKVFKRYAVLKKCGKK